MKRRDFLLRSSVAVCAGFGARSFLQAQAPGAKGASPAKPVFNPLRRGAGAFTATGGTIGWLVNRTALAAIDTQFPASAATFIADLPGREGRDFDVVVNTHHHGDHTGGNPAFRPVAKAIVAHANVPELMRARAAQDKRALDPAALPTSTFSETWRKELGDEVISARYFGAAHTRGDVVVTLEKANVVHMGDLMFNRIYPVIDRPGGGMIRGWIRVLEKVAADYPSDAIYIFGHAGPKGKVTGDRKELLFFRDYLSGLLDHVQKQIDAGKKKEEVVALENLPGFADFHQPLPNRLGGNLGVAYDELTTRAG